MFCLTGSRIPLLKTPIPASYIAVEEAVGVIRERCYRDDQTPVFKSEQFWYDFPFVMRRVVNVFRWNTKQIEDITWPLRDTELLFECWKHQQEKRNFVSPGGHVIFYLLYKHQ